MFELLFRVVAAFLLASVSFGADKPPFDFSWKLALAIVASAVFVWRIEERGLRNSGVAGFIAAADSLCIAALLGSLGVLDSLGFLVLLPVAYSASRFSASPTAMVPLSAGSLFAAHALLGDSPVPGVELFVQAAGVLTLGLLLSPTQTKIVEVIKGSDEPAPRRESNPISEAYIELKETYRTLRESYQALERRTKKEHLVAQLSEIKPEHSKYFERLSNKVKEILNVPSVAIMTVAQAEAALVVKAATGSLAQTLADKVLPIDPRSGHLRIQDTADMKLRSFTSEDQKSCCVLLLDDARVTGILCMAAKNTEELHEAREIAEGVAPVLSSFIVEANERETSARRLTESELLYEAASLALGAGDAQGVAARIARDLKDLLHLDHIGIYSLQTGSPETLAVEGAKAELLPCLQFGDGYGLEAWMNLGAEETIVFSAHEDPRCEASDATRARVGSFGLFPLGLGDTPIGFLTIASHRAGAIDQTVVETVRTISTELGQALERLSSGANGPEGCMMPREFALHLERNPEGQLVSLEPLRIEAIVKQYGRPAATLAMRRFARRLRSRLPLGGALTTRQEGGFVVYLPFKDTDQATSWANEVIALASMIEVRTPDGSSRIPFPMRSKVAELSKQQDEVFNRASA